MLKCLKIILGTYKCTHEHIWKDRLGRCAVCRESLPRDILKAAFIKLGVLRKIDEDK